MNVIVRIGRVAMDMPTSQTGSRERLESGRRAERLLSLLVPKRFWKLLDE